MFLKLFRGLPAELSSPFRKSIRSTVVPVVLAAVSILIVHAISVATADKGSWLLIHTSWWWWWWWTIETRARAHRHRSVEVQAVLLGKSGLHGVLVRGSITVIAIEARGVDTSHAETHHRVAETGSHRVAAEAAHGVTEHGGWWSVNGVLQSPNGRRNNSRAAVEEVIRGTTDGSTTDRAMWHTSRSAVRGQSEIESAAVVARKFCAAFRGICGRCHQRGHEVVDAAGTSSTGHTTTTIASSGVVVGSVVPNFSVGAILGAFGKNARMVTEGVATAHTSASLMLIIALSKP